MINHLNAGHVKLGTILQTIADLPHQLRRRTSAGGTYRPEIDGLRFFAIFMVIIGHLCERIVRFQTPISAPTGFDKGLFSLLDGPGAGVKLFFAISGFIIANQYLHKKPMPFDGTYLKNYFLRRLLRIEPPYFLLLIATYLLITATGYVPDGVHRFDAQPANLTTSLFASLFYIHSPWYGTLPRLFGPGWSLEMEVQFYILAPVFFTLLYFVENAVVRRVLQATLLMGGLVAGTIWEYAPLPEDGPIYLHYTLLSVFAFFWIGVVVADNQQALKALVQKVPLPMRELAPWVSVFAIFVLSSVWIEDGAPGVFVQMAGVSMIVLGALDDKGSFKRFCSLPWISLIGGACYSIYLVHLQVLQVTANILIRHLHLDNWMLVLAICALVLIPLVLVCGMIFYIVVERTFMIPNWPQKLWQFAKAPKPVAAE